ncbi:MAG: transposase [Bacillota bacterium]
MDALLIEESDAVNVFDRAYLDYRKFDSYCENGTLFVTRSKGNAIIEILQELPVDPNSPIEQDCIVYLGNKYTYKMKHPLRMIVTKDTEGNPVVIFTNNFRLSVGQIGDIYRYRWQIEIFFKRLKQHLFYKRRV